MTVGNERCPFLIRLTRSVCSVDRGRGGSKVSGRFPIRRRPIVLVLVGMGPEILSCTFVQTSCRMFSVFSPCFADLRPEIASKSVCHSCSKNCTLWRNVFTWKISLRNWRAFAMRFWMFWSRCDQLFANKSPRANVEPPARRG